MRAGLAVLVLVLVLGPAATATPVVPAAAARAGAEVSSSPWEATRVLLADAVRLDRARSRPE